MTRKHFEDIAKVLNTWQAKHGENPELVNVFAELCRSYNPRFDRAKFAQACTPDSQK